MSQSWIIAIMGVVVVTLPYADMLIADKMEIKKFKEEYEIYMKKVPRANFILGIILLIKRGMVK